MSALSGVQLRLVQTLGDATEFANWLGERRPVLALDTETTGLDPYEAGSGIRLLQLGDATTGWAIPYKEWYGLIHNALREYDGPVVTHNAAFEMRWLYEHAEYQIPRNQLHDTMLMAHIIDPLGSGALKKLSTDLIDPRAAAGQSMLDEAFSEHGWNWATVPVDFEPYWAYAALDAVLTARLYEMFMAKCGPGGPYEKVYDLEINTRYIISRLEKLGARVDVEYANDQYKTLTNYANALRTWGIDAHGIKIGSPGQLSKRFIDLGAEITERTPTGAPKMDKDQLEIFTIHHDKAIAELAKQTLAMRKASKYAEAYFRNIVDRADSDQLIHADIRTLGARTGRMSIGAPALQQIPKGEALVRNCFIPREGNKLVTSDFNQIEMRLLAHLSRDKDLIQTFKEADDTGGDFFVGVGSEIYGDPTFSKKDPRRSLVKNTLYGLAYGAGVRKMATTAGVPEASMREVVNGLHVRYPGIKNYMREIEDVGMRRERAEGQGYITTDTGRRLPCDVGRVYALVNYCLAPDTPILKSDLTHVPAMKIAEGDRLVAFDEHPVPNEKLSAHGKPYSIRRLRTATVEAVTTVRKPSLRITLSDNRVLVCSDDHLWLVHHHTKTQPRTRWMIASDLIVGTTLHSAGLPWEEDTSRGGGWLAGMYDGEGYLGTRANGAKTSVMTFSQLPGSVMDKFCQEMDSRALPYRYQRRSPASTTPTDSCGTTGMFNILRVLGTLRPTRFEPRFEAIYEGAALVGGTTELITVTKIEDIGMQELTSIQTTTRTLVANGILSHNCIQSTAAEIFKRGLIRLDLAGYGDAMILPVHDEIVLDLATEDVEQAKAEVPEILADVDYDVPLTADAEGGYDRWGAKYEK